MGTADFDRLASDIAHRFAYHQPPDQATVGLHERVRTHLGTVALWIGRDIPNGREKALALTHLEEAMFWANAAVARTAAGEAQPATAFGDPIHPAAGNLNPDAANPGPTT